MRRKTGTRRRLGRLVPLLILAVFGFIILRQEVPAVDDWIQRIIAPGEFAAAETCRRAALSSADSPGYARVRARGSVHKTRDGYYVEGVEIGSMGDDGAESVFRYSCYVDSNGNLVDAGREPVRP